MPQSLWIHVPNKTIFEAGLIEYISQRIVDKVKNNPEEYKLSQAISVYAVTSIVVKILIGRKGVN